MTLELLRRRNPDFVICEYENVPENEAIAQVAAQCTEDFFYRIKESGGKAPMQ